MPQDTRMAISLQRVIRYTSCLVLEWVFRIGGSNGAIFGYIKSKMAAGRYLGKFRMAVSAQRVIRYTSCLVLGYGVYRVGATRRIEWRYFRLHQVQFGGRPPSWIISNGHISAKAHSIHLYSAHRAVIFAIAQLSCVIYDCLAKLHFGENFR